MNLNEVAAKMTRLEGLKHSVNVADMKEILGKFLKTYSLEDITKMWFKYHRAKKR